MKWLRLSEIFICILFSSPVKSQQERCDSSKEFQCQQTGSCIDKKLVCDGSKDCAGGSDETESECLFRSCSRRLDFSVEFRLIDIAEASNSFQCDYGGCIPKLFVCNGLVNCLDGSDESEKYCKDMVCKEGKFRCHYGACIRYSDICNGRLNCLDGSDESEALCERSRCRKRQFRCNYGACIKQRYVCNGRVDCKDKSDELPSLCGEGHTYRSPITYELSSSFITSTDKPITTQTTDILTSPNIVPISDIFSGGNLNPKDSQLLSELFFTARSKNIGFCNFHPEDMDTSNILFCGDTSSAETRKCFSKNKVHSSTIVLSECWGTTSMILICQEDGNWLALNSRDPLKSMDNLCQPSRLHSKICGRFPYMKQYRRSKIQKQNKWPFLVGIFEHFRFICTGTIITNQWILTAAHCFPNYGKSEFNISHFGIQLSSSIGLEYLNKLSAISICDMFGMDPYFQNDVALMKLSERLYFSKSLFPACINTEGDIIEQYAATFIRKEGENDFSWDLTRQQLDVNCFNRENQCSRHLRIGRNQFCSRNSDDPVERKPKAVGASELKPGSSGGPFLVNKVGDNDDQWAVVGVVSYQLDTKGCPSYTVFSSLLEHKSWIESCVNIGFCKNS